MDLRYTESGTPYIDFGDDNKIIFSTMTKDRFRGYKYLVFSGQKTDSICISGARAKIKRYAKSTVPIRFVTDMDFKRDGSKGLPKDYKLIFSPFSIGWLKGRIKKHCKGIFFPEESLQLLENDLKSLDDYGEEEDE